LHSATIALRDCRSLRLSHKIETIAVRFAAAACAAADTLDCEIAARLKPLNRPNDSRPVQAGFVRYQLNAGKTVFAALVCVISKNK
jgi:hypothetical protein